MTQEVMIGNDEREVAKLGADVLAKAIESGVRENGVARIALSGGNTPSPTYRELAARPLPFDKIEWWWVDERAVPPDSDRSNFGKAKKDLGLGDDAKRGTVHRMRGESRPLEDVARQYEADLRRSFGVASAIAFDALVFGIGDDGHTASLFPGLGIVGVDDRLVIAVPEQPAKKLEARLTVTTPVLLQAKVALGIVVGAAKAEMFAKARSPGSEEETPSRLYQRSRGRVIWLCDRAAHG